MPTQELAPVLMEVVVLVGVMVVLILPPPAPVHTEVAASLLTTVVEVSVHPVLLTGAVPALAVVEVDILPVVILTKDYPTPFNGY
jgi:hypothetical protein